MSPLNHNNTLYRPDIDGLRALAVLAVLFFHAGFPSFSGGFVGVDVFFVISGYLITRNILRDLEYGTFSFKVFYFKRARRILPALLAMLLFTLLLGVLLLSPSLLLYLGRSLLYALFSFSNVFFQKESGYFDSLSQMNPLLHTWSLSVEEQYYFIWPLLMLFAYKYFGERSVIILLGVVLISSTLLAEYKIAHGESSKAYYWMFYRSGEFAIGALAIWGQRFVQCRRLLVLEMLSITGLLLIVYAVLCFNETMPFPGLLSVVPCLGAFLIILTGNRSKILKSILSNKYVVFIGIMSYSLYLMHWPILVFYHYWLDHEFSNLDRFVALMASALLALLLHYAVEKPFLKRGLNGKNINQARFIGGLIGSVIALSLMCVAVKYWEGIPSRIDTRFSSVLLGNQQYHITHYGGAGYPQTGKVGVQSKDVDMVIVGDSYGRQYMHGLDPLLRVNGLSVQVFFSGGCIFGHDVTRFEKGRPSSLCMQRNQDFFAFIKKNQVPIVLIQNWNMYNGRSGSWRGQVYPTYSPKDYRSFIRKHLDYFLSDIGNNVHKKLILVGVQPGSGDSKGVVQCLSRPSYLPNGCLNRFTFKKQEGYSYMINQTLNDFSDDNVQVHFINPYDAFCKNGVCESMNLKTGEIWYSDGYHLSQQGSDHAASLVMKVLGRSL